MNDIKTLIETAFDTPELLDEKPYREALHEIMEMLDQGKMRVAEYCEQEWKVNEEAKKAILLYFRTMPMRKILLEDDFEFFDKIPLKKNFDKQKVRVVPPALVRYGAFVNSGVVLMPSYVNIGSYVDSGTMIDTWATVGSCAQIGKNVQIGRAHV